mgnify:CR=1 FL=1
MNQNELFMKISKSTVLKLGAFLIVSLSGWIYSLWVQNSQAQILEKAKREFIGTERYNTEQTYIAARLDRIESKLDRLIERK